MIKTFVYGTGNPAKLSSMKKVLAPLEMNIIGLKETGINFTDVKEGGSTPLENARIKALAYYEILNCPVFSCDSGLYIEGLTEQEQPGVQVRTVGGKRRNDNEMIEHYTSIAKRFSGRVVAQYKNAICLVIGQNEIYEYFDDAIFGDAFYIVDLPHKKRIEGFPLDSISVNIRTGNYYYDEENSFEDVGMVQNGFLSFFKNILK